MTALRIRLRAALRTRWRSWLSLGLLAGALGGLAIGIAAAAKRTDGSYRRFLGSINGADVYVDPFLSEKGDSISLERVEKLPQVAQWERSRQIAVIARGRNGRPILPAGKDQIGWVLPTDGRPRERIDSLKLLHGRLPDPRRPGEVIGDTKALAILGVSVGDPVRIRTIRQHALDTKFIHLTADPDTARWGPLVTLRVVGVAANARADVDGGQMHMTPAFYERYGGPKLGSFIEELEVRLKRGQADLPAFKQAVGTIAGKAPFLLFEPGAGHPKIQHSIDLQSRALWIVAILAGLASMVIVGQALLRTAADESRDDPTLRALGAGAGHQLAFAAARSALIALPAVLVAVGVAYLVSPAAPIGWARELDPATGFAFDGTAIGIGVAGLLAVMALAGLIGGVRAVLRANTRRGRPLGRADTLAVRIIRGHGSPAFAAGVRMALGSRGGRAASGTAAAAVVAVAVTVTALTFASSFHHLTSTPTLYGQTWDYETFSGPPQPKKVVNALIRTPGISQLGAGADDTVTVGGRETGVRAWDNIKGTLAPTITKGRAPRAIDEVALGPKTLEGLHVTVGDHLNVRGRGVVKRMHVVGAVVLPSTKFNKLGSGAMMTFKALKSVDPGAVPGLYLATLADDPATAAAAKRRLDNYFDGNIVVRPDEVGDFGRIDNMPVYIALLTALAAGAALAHALVAGVQRRRRDLAVLKTLGFTRSQVAATVAWQATTIIAVAVVIGVPLGLAVGRFAWRLFADDLGVKPEVVAPLAPVLLLIPVTLILANLVAALPGWFAARIRPAPVLRTE